MRLVSLVIISPLLVFLFRSATPSETSSIGKEILLEDFESYPVGGVPTRWKTNKDRSLIPITPELMIERENSFVRQEAGNRFVRIATIDQAFRLTLSNGEQYDWDVRENSRIRWDWRAMELPEGAREDKRNSNDTGAAFYVTFSTDWLGRPRSIKYTYSSTLPVGSTASYGVLKVLVVASAPENGTGEWMTIERDVVEDYKMLFGKSPANRPEMIMLWSDSDTKNSTAVADFDNIILLGQVVPK